jgi:acylphosphatase
MRRELVTLRGRVQGVGFREQVLAIARGHAVAGTVRNVTSGRAVEIDVEGDDAAVEGFVAAVIARPPSFARVDHVERRTLALRGAIGFERAPTG